MDSTYSHILGSSTKVLYILFCFIITNLSIFQETKQKQSPYSLLEWITYKLLSKGKLLEQPKLILKVFHIFVFNFLFILLEQDERKYKMSSEKFITQKPYLMFEDNMKKGPEDTI